MTIADKRVEKGIEGRKWKYKGKRKSKEQKRIKKKIGEKTKEEGQRKRGAEGQQQMREEKEVEE